MIHLDHREMESVNRFLWDVKERWKNASIEFRCVQSLLEEVILYWQKYNATTMEFNRWLETAFTMIDAPEVDKIEFFQASLITRCTLFVFHQCNNLQNGNNISNGTF